MKYIMVCAAMVSILPVVMINGRFLFLSLVFYRMLNGVDDRVKDIKITLINDEERLE